MATCASEAAAKAALLPPATRPHHCCKWQWTSPGMHLLQAVRYRALGSAHFGATHLDTFQWSMLGQGLK